MQITIRRMLILTALYAVSLAMLQLSAVLSIIYGGSACCIGLLMVATNHPAVQWWLDAGVAVFALVVAKAAGFNVLDLLWPQLLFRPSFIFVVWFGTVGMTTFAITICTCWPRRTALSSWLAGAIAVEMALMVWIALRPCV